MTNSSLSSVRNLAVLAGGLLFLAGCGCGSSAPEDPLEAAEAASTAFVAGDYAGTVAQCRHSLALAPDNPDVLVLLARAALASGDLAAAEEAVAQVAQLRPTDVAVLQLTAQVAFEKHDYDAASRAYTRLAADATLPPELQALGWTGRGVVSLARVSTGSAPAECRDSARTDFLRALRLDRKHASAYYHLGLLYLNAFNFKQAALEQFNYYVAVTRQAPDPTHLAKAQALIQGLNEEIAAEQARRPGADKRMPSACAESLRKADAAKQKGQLKVALGLYAEALKQDPLSFEAADRLAETIYATEGRTRAGQERAYKAYAAAAGLRTYVKTLLAAADLASKLGNTASAVAYYSRAVAAKPTDTTAIDGLIRALQRSGNRRSATIYQNYRDSLATRK